MYLTQSLHRSVQQQPDAVMTVFGDRARTFREVADRVARLAGGLHSLGVAPGDRVAILALNSDRYLEYLLAVPWAGAVLNPVNIRWSPAEIVYSFADSGTRVLLIDDTFAPMLPALRSAHPDLTTVVSCGEGPAPEGTVDYEALVAAAEPAQDPRLGGDALAALLYTGGTTGFPKGVMLSHSNLLASILGTMATGDFLRRDARYLHAAPMFHIACLCGVIATNLIGGTHVIVPRFTPVDVLDAVATHAVTDTLLVPAMVQAVVDHPDLARYDLTSLRAVTYGASPISQALLERAMKALPNTAFMQGYGMTEIGIATSLSPEEHTRPHLLRSAGRAGPHDEVRIVGPDGHEVARHAIGEIAVRGANVMQGYWNSPEATAEALRDGWMHTGDAGFMDEEGFVFIVDRLKDMIVTGGENVYSAEVENAVCQHPAVAACAVIGIPDDEWGERVHAVVVLKPGASATPEELREHTRTLIAGYKAPATAEFVDALPISGAGKVLKRELRAKYWAGAERQVN